MSALVLDQPVVAHITAVTELHTSKLARDAPVGTKIKHTHSSRPAVTRQHTSVQGQRGERWRTRLPIPPTNLSHANCRNNNALWSRHGLVDIHHKLVAHPTLVLLPDNSAVDPQPHRDGQRSHCWGPPRPQTILTTILARIGHLSFCWGHPNLRNGRLSSPKPSGRDPLGPPVRGLPDFLHHRHRWVATWVVTASGQTALGQYRFRPNWPKQVRPTVRQLLLLFQDWTFATLASLPLVSHVGDLSLLWRPPHLRHLPPHRLQSLKKKEEKRNEREGAMLHMKAC